MASNSLRSVLTIIFGLILLVFPWFGLWTVAAILGFILILVGLGLLVLGLFTYRASKAAGMRKAERILLRLSKSSEWSAPRHPMLWIPDL